MKMKMVTGWWPIGRLGDRLIPCLQHKYFYCNTPRSGRSFHRGVDIKDRHTPYTMPNVPPVAAFTRVSARVRTLSAHPAVKASTERAYASNVASPCHADVTNERRASIVTASL